jgi:hypothetical protein
VAIVKNGMARWWGRGRDPSRTIAYPVKGGCAGDFFPPGSRTFLARGRLSDCANRTALLYVSNRNTD